MIVNATEPVTLIGGAEVDKSMLDRARAVAPRVIAADGGADVAAPLIVGVGFSGARLDHQLAAYNTLVRFAHRRCLLLGTEELVFLAPPELRLDLPEGCAVSLFPMGAVEGISDGLKYAINGLNFAPDGRVGTSNTALGPVTLSLTAPKMLVILPQTMMERAADALLSSRAVWPDL